MSIVFAKLLLHQRPPRVQPLSLFPNNTSHIKLFFSAQQTSNLLSKLLIFKYRREHSIPSSSFSTSKKNHFFFWVEFVNLSWWREISWAWLWSKRPLMNLLTQVIIFHNLCFCLDNSSDFIKWMMKVIVISQIFSRVNESYLNHGIEMENF